MLRPNQTPTEPITLAGVEALRLQAIGSESVAAWRAYTAARATYRRETLMLLALIETTESE
jgi:hypothetical protein